jgi:hypothetical protein
MGQRAGWYRWGVLAVVVAAICPAQVRELTAAEAAKDAAAAEARLSDAVRYLASDDLEGRGIGTKGLDLAADYLAEQFAALGLKTALYDGKPFQTFAMTTGAKLGEPNELAWVGPPGEDGQPTRVVLKLEEDFTPMAFGGSGELNVPLVFAGYGITAKEADYDDYAGIDVKDKAVILLRHEPEQDNPHSAFDGTKHSQHAPFVRKISNAYEHGAAAVIFCTDEFEINNNVERREKRLMEAIDDLGHLQAEFKAKGKHTRAELEAHRAKVLDLAESIQERSKRLEAEYDPILKFSMGGDGGESRDFPVLHCSRKALDQVLKAALDTDLATLEREIDNGPKPQSRELPGWNAEMNVHVERTEAEVKNVVAVLEGEGPHAEETIVVGAHYDHLGQGGEGSLAPGVEEIHNGADDNASGAAALIEVARQIAAQGPLPRRIVFIAFTGEERGLIGSARYVREPLVPLEKTVAMLNMDMVGRLDDDKLIVQGASTADSFDALLDQLNERYGFKLTKQAGGYGPSDHASFYAKQIPSMHFFTGTHGDYHRPSDDAEKINAPGMKRVADLVAEMTIDLAKADDAPKYQEAEGGHPAAPGGGGGGDRPYFGSIPDFSQDRPGYALTGVSKDGPAEKAGLKAGDIIVQVGDSKIGNLEDFDSALRKFKAGDKVPVRVERESETLTFEVVLGEPR